MEEIHITMDRKDKIGYTIGFAFLVLMGLWAILDPSALDEYAASELSGGLKQMFAEAWGAKLGMVLVAMGALALFGLHQVED